MPSDGAPKCEPDLPAVETRGIVVCYGVAVQTGSELEVKCERRERQ